MIDLVKEFPNLNRRYLKEIENTCPEILNSEKYLINKKYMQHGDVSIFEHCILVTCRCLELADRSKKKIDRRKLIKAALLHDYFLYDWHVDKDKSGGKKHSYRHPHIAADNAKRDFGLDDVEENAIRSHMWPLGNSFPKSKEAWILFEADKDSAFKETFKEGKFKW